MSAAFLNLSLEQGVDYTKTFTVQNALGGIFPLTGYTAFLTIKKYQFSIDTIIEASTSNGKLTIDALTGSILLQLTSADTTLVDTKRSVYQLKIVSQTGKVTRILEGEVSCSLAL